MARKPRKWHKPPYFKIQLFDSRLATWMDDRKAYDEEEQARKAISGKYASRHARVVLVEDAGRTVVAEFSGDT